MSAVACLGLKTRFNAERAEVRKERRDIGVNALTINA
jgi:hypothetical protein